MAGRADRFRRAYESIIRQEPDWDLIAPEVVYVQHFGIFAGEYRGHDGLREWLELFGEVWVSSRGVVEELTEKGDELHARVRMEVHSRETDLDFVFRGLNVVRLDAEGRILRADAYDAEQAEELASR